MDTIPVFRKAHPDVVCDVMLIDGSKDGDHRTKDMRTFRAMSYTGAMLFLDASVRPPRAPQPPLPPPLSQVAAAGVPVGPLGPQSRTHVPFASLVRLA